MSAATLSAGEVERFGRFIVLKPLAQGGMGAVTLSYDPDAKRLVVLKRIRPARRGEAELVVRFGDEIALTSKLHNPNLIALVDSGKIGDELFLALEWVAGQDLATISDRSRRYSIPIPLPVLALVFRDLCRALHYAHGVAGLGFVHRDISPANIVVSYDGRPCLIDYGMALSTLKTTNTEPGILAGTRGFLSPEQRDGKPCDLRTDLWALGAVFWFLVAGRHVYNPFQADENPGDVRLSSIVDVPALIDAWSTQAISTNPADRFQTAEAMAAPLDLYLRTNPATAEDVAAFVALIAPLDREKYQQEAPELLARGEALARLARQTTVQLRQVPMVAPSVQPGGSTGAPVASSEPAPITAPLGMMELRPPAVVTAPAPVVAVPEPAVAAPVAKVDAPAATPSAVSTAVLPKETQPAQVTARSTLVISRPQPGNRWAMIVAATLGIVLLALAIVWVIRRPHENPSTAAPNASTPQPTTPMKVTALPPRAPQADEIPPLDVPASAKTPVVVAVKRTDAHPIPPLVLSTHAPVESAKHAIETAPLPQELADKLAQANQWAVEGQTERALAVYHDLERDPRSRLPALLGHAQLAVSHGNFDDAIETATRAIGSGGGTKALLLRARAEQRATKTADAQRDYRTVLARQPDNAEAQKGAQ